MTKDKSLCLSCGHVIIGGLFLWCSEGKYVIKACSPGGVCEKFKEKEESNG